MPAPTLADLERLIEDMSADLNRATILSEEQKLSKAADYGGQILGLVVGSLISIAESQRTLAEEAKQIMEVSADMRDPSKWEDVKPKSFREDLSDLLCRHWKPGVRADLVSELEIASYALVKGDDPTMPF